MRLSPQDGWSMPAGAPFYPPLPAVYRHVRSHYVFFTSRPEAVRGFLPEPLEPSPDALCVACGLEVPFCTSYGPFQESFVMLRCTFGGRSGYYCSHVFHNGPAGIAAGREIYGTPKVYAELRVRQEGRAMFTETYLGGTPVLSLSSAAGEIGPPGGMPDLSPNWRLKIIPRADGPGPALKQLVDCSRVARDLEIHFLAKGLGVVRFQPSPLVDLTPLGPESSGDAYYVESSFSEHYAEIVHDYLKLHSGGSSPS